MMLFIIIIIVYSRKFEDRYKGEKRKKKELLKKSEMSPTDAEDGPKVWGRVV